MHNYSRLNNLIKQIAMGVVENSKPTKLLFGIVKSTSPLVIEVEQRLPLNENQLILSRNVTDYNVFMTVDHTTENRSGGSGEASYSSHNHEYIGKKEFTVHNALEVGEEVILIRSDGGQKFLVLDRKVSI